MTRPIRHPARWEPAPVGVENHQHQQAKHKGRQGGSHNAENPGGLVNETVLVNSRLHPQPDPHQDHRGNRPEGQVEGVRETVADQINDRLGARARVAKIAEEDARLSSFR